MRRVNNIFEEIVSFSNLFNAFKKALKGAGKNKEAERFYFNLENELIKLQKELINGNYAPGEYRLFNIYEPKERIIAAAPFRDRVVHHALINVLEPIFEKVFIYDSYATRKGKGTHKAVLRAQHFLNKSKWFLKTDVKKYFESINKNLLINIIERKIKDPQLMDLIKKIIFNDSYSQNATGLPIGNLTSQFFANVYLDRLDHYLKDFLGVKYYVRYMDDLVVFNNDKNELKYILKLIKKFLTEELNLEIKEKATFINKRDNGLSFLGTRIFKKTIRIKRENLKRSFSRIKRREWEYKNGKISDAQLYQSVQSIFAHISFYNTFSLRRSLKLGELS